MCTLRSRRSRVAELSRREKRTEDRLQPVQQRLRIARFAVTRDHLHQRLCEGALDRVVSNRGQTIRDQPSRLGRSRKNFRNPQRHVGQEVAMIGRIEPVDVFLAEELHQLGEDGGRRGRLFLRRSR